MKSIYIKSPLFEPILDLEIVNQYIDLHNDFDCKKITQLSESNQLYFYFQSITSKQNQIIVFFDNAQITKSKYSITDTSKSVTISNFQRGKFQSKNNKIIEENKTKQKYYYIDFSEGQQIELFAQRLEMKILNNKELLVVSG